MTDAKFQELLNATQRAMAEYHSLLDKAEVEYVRRYGFHPSDKDDDFWLDSMHQSPSPMTVKQVKLSAMNRV